MKKTILLLIFLMIPLAYALDNCKGTMSENEVPCLLLLTVNQTTTPCTTLNVSVYNNGSTLLYTQQMHQYNPFKCNATFNQSAFGTYTFRYETEDTGSITIEEDLFQQYYLYLIVVGVFLILVTLGWWKEEGIFVMIAGMLAMVIGINIFVNGFPNLTNTFLRNGITAIIWGVGAYLILKPAMDFFENWRDKE